MSPNNLKTINLVLLFLIICAGFWLLTAWQENEYLEKEHERITDKYYSFILEGLKSIPSLWVEATYKMRTGEVRLFTISVIKLGEQDEVVLPPNVSVFHDDSLMYVLEYPSSIIDSIVYGTTGLRLYHFHFTAPSHEGSYKLLATAQTNHISVMTDGLSPIKVGNLSVNVNDFNKMVTDDILLSDTYKDLTASALDSLMQMTSTIDIQVVR